MEMLDFLLSVLPRSGIVVLGLPTLKPNGRTRWTHESFATIEAAAVAAQKIDDRGDTVYFAVNTFGDWYTNKKGYRVIRKQENVVCSRALYDDYDVDTEKESVYDTKQEALLDIVRVAKALELTPSIVDSGGGYHTYIHFNEELDKATWDELSAIKRQISRHLNTKTDALVDIDSARVLRPVGSHNRKYDPPVPVVLKKQGVEYSVAYVRGKMLDYIRDNNVMPEPVKGGFGYVSEYGPSLDREKARVAALEGDEWYNNVLKLVASYVTKGLSDAEIHELVSDLTEGEPKSGPPRAEQIQPMIDGAREKGFAPPDIAPVEPDPDANNDDAQGTSNATTLEGETIPYWPTQGFRWNGVALSRSVTDADGVSTWHPFCRSFIYPLNRIKDADGTWVIHWRAKEKNGNWREFMMPTYELASTDLMAKTFAANEVFLLRTRNARNHMAEFAENLIETLQAWKIETKTYGQFGWLPDRSGFVMGTKIITEKGTENVLCNSSVPEDVAIDFGRSGTLEAWVSSIDKLYNRDGAEPFQFALCHSMGSALVELMGSSNWHGLPLAFTGEGSTGKTTACKIACGFYGNHKHMERQTGENGTTLNAVIKRIAIMGSIPMLLDEFSGRTAEELSRTGYALANGRDKERLKTNGDFATVGGQWFKNSFITSNDSILESISKLPGGYKVEATQLRFFEVPMPKGYKTKVFPDITQSFVEHHMDNMYGEACLPYLRFIIKNKDWVRRQMVAARSKFNPQSEDETKERFYRDTIVTALVAGKIAEKIGLVSFDLNRMKKWAMAQVKNMRLSRKEVNTDTSEHLSSFISTLHGRLIVTRRLGNANANKEDSSMILRAPPAGRLCTEDKKAFILVKALSDWCKESGATPASMREELEKAEYLIFQSDGKPSKRMYLGQGSTIPSGLTRCYEINYEKLMDGISKAEEESDDA